MSKSSEWAKANPDLTGYGIPPVITNRIADIVRRRGPLIGAIATVHIFARKWFGLLWAIPLAPVIGLATLIATPGSNRFAGLAIFVPWLLLWLTGVSIVDAIAWSAGVFFALGSVAYALGIFRAFHPEKEG
jgi:hypothetical protein